MAYVFWFGERNVHAVIAALRASVCMPCVSTRVARCPRCVHLNLVRARMMIVSHCHAGEDGAAGTRSLIARTKRR